MKTMQKKLGKIILLLGVSFFIYSYIGVDPNTIFKKQTTGEKSLGEKIYLSDLDKYRLLYQNETPKTYLAKNLPTVLANGTTWYDKEQLKQILAAFNILGSGGGGSYFDGLTILAAMKQDGVEVIDVQNTDDNKLYVVAGGMGQPSALKAQIPETIASIKIAINALVAEKKIPLGGILNVEAGPVNGILAVLMAAELGVPVVNADGGGRSVPSLTNLTYAYENYPIAPVFLKPSGKDIQRYNSANAADAEAAIGAYMKANNVLLAGLALWPQTGKELKASQVSRGSYSNAYQMGIATTFTMYLGEMTHLNNYLVENKKYISSFEETLVNYSIRNVENRFDAINITTNSKTIRAINENLLIRQRYETDTINKALATAPNLISFLIKDTSIPGRSCYLPFNNADTTAMKESIGKKIFVIESKPPTRVYYPPIQESFLNIMKATLGYKGPVEPSTQQGLSNTCWKNAFGSNARITSHDIETGVFRGTYGSTTGSAGYYTIIGKTPAHPNLDTTFPITFTIGWGKINGIPDDASQYWSGTMSGYYQGNGNDKKLNLLNVISAPGAFNEVKIFQPGNLPQTQAFTLVGLGNCNEINVPSPPLPTGPSSVKDKEFKNLILGSWYSSDANSFGLISRISINGFIPRGKTYPEVRYYEVTGDFYLKNSSIALPFVGLVGQYIPSTTSEFAYAMSIVGSGGSSSQPYNIALSGFTGKNGTMKMFLTKSEKYNMDSKYSSNTISSGELFQKQ
jgi:hypothetical protein